MSDGNVTAPVKVNNNEPQLMEVPKAFFEYVLRADNPSDPVIADHVLN